jgi:hypothetical protein
MAPFLRRHGNFSFTLIGKYGNKKPEECGNITSGKKEIAMICTQDS